MSVEIKSPDYEEVIIRGVKNSFFLDTGKYIKVVKCERWESTANFTFNASIGQIIKMVFDFTGWTWEDTFIGSPIKSVGRDGKRTTERVFRRGLIDYLAVNNGCTLNSCSVFTGRGDHTTIINSIKKFEDRLDTDGYIRKSLLEVADFCKNNYYLYKGRDFTKEEIIQGGE